MSGVKGRKGTQSEKKKKLHYESTNIIMGRNRPIYYIEGKKTPLKTLRRSKLESVPVSLPVFVVSALS